jgi:outer membrane protein TolC
MQIRCFIGLALLALVPCRGAEETALSVTDAIETALRRNHDLARAALATAGGEIGVAGAKSEFAPSLLPRGGVNASSSADTWSYGLAVAKKLPQGTVIRISGDARRTSTDDDIVVERVESAVEIRQPLFRNFGTLVQRENVRLADSRLRQTHRDFELQKQDLVLDVIDTYDTLIRLQRQLEADASFRERAEQLYKLTGIRERQGRASRVATLRAELQKGQADARLANTQERLFSTRRRFAELLGYDPETDFVLASAPALNLDVPEIPEAVRIALENRLDYAQVLQDLTDRERAEDIAQRVRLPELSVVSRYTRFGEGDSLSDAVDLDEDDWFVGITTDTDYNLARNRSTIGRARVNVQSAEQTLRIFEVSIARQVQQQVAAYQRAQVEKTIAARNLELAENRAELARRLFKVGRGDHFAVTDAEDAFVEARNQWLNAESEASLSGYRVLRVLGTLVETPDGLKPDHTRWDS